MWCNFASAPGGETPYNLAGSMRTARTDSRSTMSALMSAGSHARSAH
jgi:hypothetical protein